MNYLTFSGQVTKDLMTSHNSSRLAPPTDLQQFASQTRKAGLVRRDRPEFQHLYKDQQEKASLWSKRKKSRTKSRRKDPAVSKNPESLKKKRLGPRGSDLEQPSAPSTLHAAEHSGRDSLSKLHKESTVVINMEIDTRAQPENPFTR